jgi:hypothetical protein
VTLLLPLLMLQKLLLLKPLKLLSRSNTSFDLRFT